VGFALRAVLPVPGLLSFRVKLLQPGVEGGEPEPGRCPPLHLLLLLLLCHLIQAEKPTCKVDNNSPARCYRLTGRQTEDWPGKLQMENLKNLSFAYIETLSMRVVTKTFQKTSARKTLVPKIKA
jgi:hypothetical protein